MTDSAALVLDWGGLVTDTDKQNTLDVALDNSVDAFGHADYSGRRLSYAETLHDLTHAAVQVVEVWPGETTEAGFDAQIATRAGAAVRVLTFTIADTENGGTHTYWWSDRVVANVDTLYSRAVFTGLIDSWSYTLNRFRLHLTGTERSEERTLPERVVTFGNWPLHGETEGRPYPEVYGSPGSALDSDKIGDGLGSVPSVLVDRAARQYVVAGHALTDVAGETNESNTVALWCAIPGFRGGLGYIEGCSFDLSGTDDDGNTIATVTLPTVALPRVYLPTLTTGSYRTNTAADPGNATGRDASTVATLTAGERLQLALRTDLSGQGGTILRVWIACGATDTDLRARWTGPRATIQATGSGYVDIDSGAGWDQSGTVQLTSGTYTFANLREVSAGGDWRLDIDGYSGSDTGDALQVGSWHTVSANDTDVSDERDWTQGDFYKFELELEHNGASGTHTVPYLGLRVEFALNDDPDVYVPCSGVGVTFRGTGYGATRNPVLHLEDVHTRLLGLDETARIGSTFDAVRGLLSAWRYDWSLLAQTSSDEVISRIVEQARAFTWRDGDNKVQIGVYRLDDAATLTLDSAADIVDPHGDDVRVSLTTPEEIFNRVTVQWGWDYALQEYRHEYYIREDDSRPADTARETEAGASQSKYDRTAQLTVEAPYIQDGDTAAALLRFLFDFHRVRRHRLDPITVPMQVEVTPGTVIRVQHPLLDSGETFLVEQVVRRGSTREITAVALAISATYDSAVGYKVSVTTDRTYLNGSRNFWVRNGAISAGAATTAEVGRVVDYGLQLWANRQYTDTAEKATHGGVGSGDAGEAPEQLALDSQTGARHTFYTGYPQRSSTQVTWRFHHLNISGGDETVREIGLFSDATALQMLARVLLASDLTLPDEGTLEVEVTIDVTRPTGSGLTDYGRDLLAQRLYQDTSEKPTHYAIGTDGTAQSGSDVALNTQLGARQAWSTGYPQEEILALRYSALFAAATYGGNTIREVGIFTAATGNNAVVRHVPDDAVVLAATDDFAADHAMPVRDDG